MTSTVAARAPCQALQPAAIIASLTAATSCSQLHQWIGNLLCNAHMGNAHHAHKALCNAHTLHLKADSSHKWVSFDGPELAGRWGQLCRSAPRCNNGVGCHLTLSSDTDIVSAFQSQHYVTNPTSSNNPVKSSLWANSIFSLYSFSNMLPSSVRRSTACLPCLHILV
jgi:hypothetical protein